MEKQNNAIFEGIIETRSLTVIHNTVDDALPKTLDEVDNAILRQIQGLNCLDSIWIVCHSRLANWHLYQVGAIRAFLETKKGRR